MAHLPPLEARELRKNYRSVAALDGVSFVVERGVTGLLGPNGAGKSAAIKLFLGLPTPTSGEALVMGESAGANVEVRARMGYMPEHGCLPSGVSASEFLTHMAQISGLPPDAARARAADILRRIALDEERYRPIGEYFTDRESRESAIFSI